MQWDWTSDNISHEVGYSPYDMKFRNSIVSYIK